MNTQQIRTTVVGAGAIGGLMAAALARAGHAVSVLARGKTLDAIRADGIRILDDTRETVARVAAESDANVPGVQDFVVIALKAQTLPAIARSLTPLMGPQTVVVAAMNGLPWWFLHDQPGPLAGHVIEAVDPDGVVSASLPPARSLGCVVHLSSSTDAPGVIRRGRGNQLIVGAPSASLSAQASAFAEALREGGFDVSLTQQIRTEIWVKLWGNMNMNPLSALTGSTADRLLDDPLTHALVLRMMEEADAIGTRLGLSTGMAAPQRVALTRKLGAFRTSMLQDLEQGARLKSNRFLACFLNWAASWTCPRRFVTRCLGCCGNARSIVVCSGS